MAAATNPARFPCPGCSAAMEFDPASNALKCSYCGTTQRISLPVSAEVRELAYDEYAREGAGERRRIAEQALEVTCSSCGSTVEFQPPEVAGACPFCAASIVVQPKAADPMIAPNGTLPFALPKDRAAGQIREWLSSRWFAPSQLKSLARPEGIHGVYVPFWTYDARTDSQYRGARGDYYYETEYVMVRNAQGQTTRQAQQVRKTRWTSVSGRVANQFDDVLIPASRAIDERRLRDLAPWDLEEIKPYEPSYLAGFKAQRYQVEVAPGFDEAQQIMRAQIENSVAHDIGGDEQRIDGVDTDWFDVTFKHILLPVWIGAYRFGGKVYQVTVNARTGEVQGERPYSAVKIAAFVLLCLCVVMLIALLSREQ